MKNKIQKWMDAKEELNEIKGKVSSLREEMLSSDIRYRILKFNRELSAIERALFYQYEKDMGMEWDCLTRDFYNHIELIDADSDSFTINLTHESKYDSDDWEINLPFDETLDGKYLERAKKKIIKYWGIRAVEYRRNSLERKQKEVDRLTKELAEAHANQMKPS